MDLKQFYEQSAKSYNPETVISRKGWKKYISHDDRFEIMIRYFNQELSDKKGVKILDVGCGDGVYEKNIKKDILKDNFFVGLDFSTTQLERSAQIFDEVKEMNFEKDKIPFSENYFDYVVCSEVLEHLFFPEHILSEIKRVLKPGGKLIITTPNLKCIQNRLSMFLFGDSPNFNYLQNKEHIRFYTKKTIKKIIGNDFELLKQIGINSMLFEKYLFPVRIILPYFVQYIFNKIWSNGGAGLFLIFKKDE